MITVVDYGSGNIKAILNVFKRLKIECAVASRSPELSKASKIILPGVGAFDQTMHQLDASGLRSELNDLVLNKKLPVLGICVGMQVMANSSEEGTSEGLGWIDGTVRRFPTKNLSSKPHLPHMGWNTVAPLRSSPLFNNVDQDRGFYFLHSYFFDCKDQAQVLAAAHYGLDFPAVVMRENIIGCQFHPEKSHSNGISVFKNFAEMA